MNYGIWELPPVGDQIARLEAVINAFVKIAEDIRDNQLPAQAEGIREIINEIYDEAKEHEETYQKLQEAVKEARDSAVQAVTGNYNDAAQEGINEINEDIPIGFLNVPVPAYESGSADEDGVKSVEIHIPESEEVKGYESALPSSFFNANEVSRTVVIKTDIAELTVPDNMFASTDLEGMQKVSITIANGEKSSLSKELQEKTGNRPILELNVKMGEKTTNWRNENTSVIVAIPYTPTAEELANPEHIVVWYIDGSGNVVEVPSGRYDAATGMVTFSTTHFSRYAAAYVIKTFEDLGSVPWAKKQAEVLVSKGIVKGMSEKEYAPSADITRADFLYSLVRTLGADAIVEGNFEDISSEAYYWKEIAIAKKLGITKGSGGNRFNPDECITRQDMMVLTERTLRMLNKLEQHGMASDLEKFADRSLIAAYAVDGIASVVKEGLIAGSDGRINPLGKTTRAEAAVILYRIYNKY